MKRALLALLLWSLCSQASAMTFRDWFVPASDRDTTFRFDFRTATQRPLASEGSFAGLKIPLYVGFDIVVVDDYKRIRLVPIAGSLSYVQNGRGLQFDSVSYGQTVGLIEGEVFLHSRWHLLYETALYRSGLEYHLGSAGLQMGLGFRYVFWSPSVSPLSYGRNHVHLFVQPLSVVWMGRLDLAEEFGDERLVVALNAAAGLQGAWSPSRFWTVAVSSNLFFNFNLQQSLLWRNEVSLHWKAHPVLEVRLEARLQIPLRPLWLRTNVYEAYFLDNPSFMGGVQFLWSFAHPATFAGGKR